MLEFINEGRSHEISLVAQSLIDDDGRMCRQRASKLSEALKCNILKAADVFTPNDAPSTRQQNV